MQVYGIKVETKEIIKYKEEKKKMRQRTKANLKGRNGITLIALVITIIVLIILAGVSINLILGENGIIAKARQASKKK